MSKTTARMTRFILQNPEGKWATYDMRSGPYLTDNPNLRYTWDNRQRADQQAALYASTLKTTFTVVEV